MRSKSEQLAQIRVAATCPVSEIEDSPAMALTHCYDYHHHHPDDVLNEVSGKIGTSAESKVNPGPSQLEGDDSAACRILGKTINSAFCRTFYYIGKLQTFCHDSAFCNFFIW